MLDEPNVIAMVGLFDEPEEIVRAAALVHESGWKRWDCHTPYAVHGLEEAMGEGMSMIPFFVLFAGFIGAALGKLMQWWMSAWNYPLIVGGKPLFSIPAFVPITFELFVLFGAITGFVCIIRYCRLGHWHTPLYQAGIMEQVTSNRFAMVMELGDEGFDAERAREILEKAECKEVVGVYGGGDL